MGTNSGRENIKNCETHGPSKFAAVDERNHNIFLTSAGSPSPSLQTNL